MQKSVTLLAILASFAAAQSDLCYFPNGDWAKDGQASCTTGGGACCALNWECLSNGLCYNPAANETGRYGCTDRSWQSGACTQICTNGNTAIGNEAILHCYGDVYCCNGDGSLDCCNHIGQANYNDFRLPSGSVIRSITSVNRVSPTLQATTNSAATATDGTPLSTIVSSTTTTTRQTTSAVSSSTVVSQITTTSNGQLVTRTQTSIVTITAPASGGGGGGGSNTGRTIGLAVGIPVGVILLGAIAGFFFLRRRRQRKADDIRAHYANEDPKTNPDLRNSYGHFPPAGRAPEIDSFPVADTKHTQSELIGSVPGLGGVPPPPPTYSTAGSEKASSIRGLNEGSPVELDGNAIPVGKAELPGSSPLRSDEKQG